MMKKQTVNSKQFVMMMAMFIIGSSMVTDGNRVARQDTWLVTLFALAAAVPVVIMYARISNIYPDCNIFDILYNSFGKIAGFVLSLILILYFLFLAVTAVRSFNVYNTAVVFEKTPAVLSAVPLAIICAWMIIGGVQVMGRMSVLLFWMIAASFVFVTSLSARHFEWENILPVLYRPSDDVLRGGLAAFAAPFCESVVFLSFSGSLRRGGSKYGAYCAGLLTGGLALVCISLRNILILGEYTYSALYFPSNTAISMVNIGQYLQRIESIISANFLFCILIRFSVCVYAAVLGIKHILGLKKGAWLIFVLALTVAGAALPLSGGAKGVTMPDTLTYYQYVLPVQLALPALIWITAEIRRKRAGGHSTPAGR